MKHTPAPWNISDGSIWANSPLNARIRIADIRKHASMNNIDSEANALLIAAAPELLESAKRLLEIFDSGVEPFKNLTREQTNMVHFSHLLIKNIESK